MPDVAFENKWPSPNKPLPAKVVTILRAGPRLDTPIDPNILSATNTGASQTNAVIQIAACEQPLQLDVWTQSNYDRDDVVARIDQFLHYGESGLAGVVNPDVAGMSLLLALGDGWDAQQSTASFSFHNPEISDDADSAMRSQYRASYRGSAYCMLTISQTIARQKILNFKAFLDTPFASNGVPDVSTVTSST